MKLLYCSYSQIPSNTANSIAVMQQCAALHKKNTLKAILIHGLNSEENVFCRYSVDEFPLRLLPKSFLGINELGLKVFSVLYALLWKPDIVYSRDVLINKWLCMFHIHNIYEIHQLNMNDESFDYQFKKTLNWVKTNRYLDNVICISNTLRKECLVFGIPDEKIRVLHSGAPSIGAVSRCESICIRKLFKNNYPIALYVGSLQKGKGIDTIINMANICDSYNFLIIGGEKGEILETGNLRHISQVAHDLALQYMHVADFLLLPVQEQDYRFHSPLKLFEYLAAGRPIIASYTEDLAEIVSHKTEVMFATPSDPHDFIYQMKLVETDAALKNRLCSNSLAKAAQFTWEQRAEKICQIIRENK